MLDSASSAEAALGIWPCASTSVCNNASRSAQSVALAARSPEVAKAVGSTRRKRATAGAFQRLRVGTGSSSDMCAPHGIERCPDLLSIASIVRRLRGRCEPPHAGGNDSAAPISRASFGLGSQWPVRRWWPNTDQLTGRMKNWWDECPDRIKADEPEQKTP